jgi:hypothetical protein
MDPERVTQDRDFPRRKCFYRKARVPYVTAEEYLKVIVEYAENAYAEEEGWIITAFPIKAVPSDEEQIWPSDQ